MLTSHARARLAPAVLCLLAACGGGASPVAGPPSAARSTLAVAGTPAVADLVAAVTITATVRDASGSPLTGRRVVFSLPGLPDAALDPAAATTDAAGVARTVARSTRAGAGAARADVEGVVLAAAPSVAFVAGPAARLVFTAAPASATVRAPLFPAPAVAVVDAFGNLADAPPLEVTLRASGPSALVGAATVASAAAVASFPGLSLPQQGVHVLEASAPGIPAASGPPLEVVDDLPPATPDLVAAAAGANGVRLTWTAPGDDGALGPAAAWELRRGRVPFTPATFEEGTAVASGQPAAAGQPFDLTALDLEAATRHAFVLRVTDDAGNVAHAFADATTAPCPAGQAPPACRSCLPGWMPAGGGCARDPRIAICPALPAAPAGAVCAVSGAPAGGAVRVRGNVLSAGRVVLDGEVAIGTDGRVACVGCDCAAAVPGAPVVTCPGASVSPGLVNLMEHAAFSVEGPAPGSDERYDHRHEWRRGLDGHTQLARGGVVGSAVATVELRHLLAGTTSTVGGGSSGLLRNLDGEPEAGLGLPAPEVYRHSFPLGDGAGPLLASGCAYPAILSPGAFTAKRAALLDAAQGVNAAARNEVLCLDAAGLLLPHVALVGGGALGAADLAGLATRSVGLVWSPRSDVSLYGFPVQAPLAARLGVRTALATTWSFTGSANLLRELRCAAELDAGHFGGALGDERLWRMVTVDAGVIAGHPFRVGDLRPGAFGDVAVFAGHGRTPHRAVIEAEPADVALVLRAGAPLAGEAAVMEALGAGACDAIEVCGAAHRVCAAETGSTLSSLRLGARYPLFTCGGPPPGERTCVPSRSDPWIPAGGVAFPGAPAAGDRDGDGVPDLADLCPDAFDAIRPVDAGRQPDADADLVGDACDPCPLDAGVACPPPDPDDLDRDGAPDPEDVCVDLFDPEQLDGDGDGRGDACDPCPLQANPGEAPCPPVAP